MNKKSNYSKPGDTSDTSFEDSLTFLISTLGSRIALIAEQSLRKNLDLAYMEWRIIQIVGTEPDTQPKRIIAITGVNKANVSRAINSLESRGLVKRSSLDGHARYSKLNLTKEGMRIYRRGNTLRKNSEIPLFDGLGDKEKQQLGTTLRKIMRNVDVVRDAE